MIYNDEEKMKIINNLYSKYSFRWLKSIRLEAKISQNRKNTFNNNKTKAIKTKQQQ